MLRRAAWAWLPAAATSERRRLAERLVADWDLRPPRPVSWARRQARSLPDAWEPFRQARRNPLWARSLTALSRAESWGGVEPWGRLCRAWSSPEVLSVNVAGAWRGLLGPTHSRRSWRTMPPTLLAATSSVPREVGMDRRTKVSAEAPRRSSQYRLAAQRIQPAEIQFRSSEGIRKCGWPQLKKLAAMSLNEEDR